MRGCGKTRRRDRAARAASVREVFGEDSGHDLLANPVVITYQGVQQGVPGARVQPPFPESADSARMVAGRLHRGLGQQVGLRHHTHHADVDDRQGPDVFTGPTCGRYPGTRVAAHRRGRGDEVPLVSHSATEREIHAAVQ